MPARDSNATDTGTPTGTGTDTGTVSPVGPTSTNPVTGTSTGTGTGTGTSSTAGMKLPPLVTNTKIELALTEQLKLSADPSSQGSTGRGHRAIHNVSSSAKIFIDTDELIS